MGAASRPLVASVLALSFATSAEESGHGHVAAG